MPSTKPCGAPAECKQGCACSEHALSLLKVLGTSSAAGYGIHLLATLVRHWLGAALSGGPRDMELLRAVTRQSRQLLSNSQSIRFGMFCGSFGFAYRFMSLVLKRWIRPGSTAGHATVSALSGGVAGLSLFWMPTTADSSIDRVSLSLNALVRALDAALLCLRDNGVLPAVPHFDSAVFILSCTEIMYSWFYHPDALPKVYNTWITKMAAMDTRLLDLLRRLKDGRLVYGRPTAHLSGYCRDHGLPHGPADFTAQLPCLYVHPAAGSSCTVNSYQRLAAGFSMSLKLYGPLYTLLALLSRRGRIVEPPVAKQAVKHIVTSSLRSSLFLGSFISIVWTTVCAVRQLLGDDVTFGPWLGSFLCGFSVLIEKADRRRELACYVLPRAMQTLWHRLGIKPVMPHGDVAIFCFASAVFMAVYNFYATHPHAEREAGPQSRGEPDEGHIPLVQALQVKARMSSALFITVRILTQGW